MTTATHRIEDGRLVGSRITVWDVLVDLEGGFTKQEILEILPIDSDQFETIVEFVSTNREWVYRIHEEIEERHRRGNPPEFEEILKQTRKRIEQWRRQRRATAPHPGDPGNGSERAGS